MILQDTISYLAKLCVPSDCRNRYHKCQNELYGCIKDTQYQHKPRVCSDLWLEVEEMKKNQDRWDRHTNPTERLAGTPESNTPEKCERTELQWKCVAKTRAEESHQAGYVYILYCTYALCDKHIKFYDINHLHFMRLSLIFVCTSSAM